MAASESQEQVALMDWLRLQYPEVAQHTIYICNEAVRSPRTGALFKRKGLMPGASDLYIAWPNGKYHGLFIELKTKIGLLSEKQRNFLQRMNCKGYLGVVARGADEAIEIIKEYLG